jgi:Tfp pilus assembly protein PilE
MMNLAKRIISCVLSLVLLVVMPLISASCFGWQAAQRAGNEVATQQDLKTIAAVEIQYYNTHNRTFGTFAQMIDERMLTAKFSGNPPATDGYVFNLNIIPKTSSQPTSYTLNADPQSAATGKNHFYIDSNSLTIHVNPDQPASAADPRLGD